MKYIANIISEVLTWCHTIIEAPTLLTATLVPPDIDLAWVDNSDNETGFYIWRSTDGTNFEIIDTVPANTESYTDTTVVVDQEYWYQVQAYNDDATSNVSNTVSTGVIITDVSYGLLYNWFVASEIDYLLAADGWHVPTRAEFEILTTYLGGNTVSGGKLKEIGFTYWDNPNTGATNEVNFNGRGSARRSGIDGLFTDIKDICDLWTQEEYALDPTKGRYCQLAVSNLQSTTTNIVYDKPFGSGIRLLKDSTTLIHGQTGLYTGNDGKIYRTICIDTQEWLADNLAETKYSNGDTIPEVTDAGAWAALATGALCAYDNDWNYV